jgi:hypothetical protein
MAIRSTTHILKNSDIVNRPLPSSLLKGEPIINTADGIMYFSGVTTSTSEWTPAGTGTTSNFFEVGSNLYDLRLRNQITQYQGESGNDLVGKFLSGTTSGFVLADITSIGGVTDFTYNPTNNTFTITQADNSTLTASINEVSGFTVSGDLFVTGSQTVNNLTITGTGIYNTTATGTNPNEIVNWSALTGYSQTSDIYVTGATYTGPTNNTNTTTFDLEYAGNLVTGPHSLTGTDTFVTGGTYDNVTSDITFTKNDGSSFDVDLSSLDLNDTFSTGGTITQTIDDNNNQQTVQITGNNGFTPYNITGLTDTFTTGGTYDNNTSLITFDKNDGSNYTIDLSSIDVNDTFSTGGTVTQFATNNSNEQTVQITGNDGFTPYNITGLTDTFATGFTFTPNTLTISQNNGVDLTANIDSIDLSGVLSGVTFDINTTGNITATSFSGTSFSGGTFYGDGSNLTGIDDFYVTGGTVSYDSNELNGTLTLTRNDGNTVTITGFTDVQTTGATLVGTTVFFDTNESLSAYTLDLSALDVNDTFVTGFTYNPTTNTITLSQNEGQPNLDISINSVSGLTFSNLTPGRVVYVGTGGELTDEAGFEYNDGTDLLTVGNIFVNNPSGTTANIGQGGLVIGSGGSSSMPGIGDLVVHGDLTVFGDTTTISTSELYIEDPQITLNYNPTGDTSVTSIGSGILIQDGGGVSGQDVKIGVGQLFGSSISGDTSEYTTTTGFENRGWVTQLNDIVIRNSSPVNFGDPDGVRVLAEFDVLDGGFY